MKKVIKLLVVCLAVGGLSAEAFADPIQGLSKRSERKLARAKKKPATPGAPGGGGDVSLSDYCKTIKPISALFKNTMPGHIGPHDPRAPGFALVCNWRECPRAFPAEAFYSDGAPAFKLGYYGRWIGNFKPRAYTGTGGAAKEYVGTVVSESRQKGRDGKAYIVFDKKAKSCRSVIPGKRQGSPF